MKLTNEQLKEVLEEVKEEIFKELQEDYLAGVVDQAICEALGHADREDPIHDERGWNEEAQRQVWDALAEMLSVSWPPPYLPGRGPH